LIFLIKITIKFIKEFKIINPSILAYDNKVVKQEETTNETKFKK